MKRNNRLESASYFNQVMIILSGSVISTALLRRFRLPPVLGYLIVGLLIGPYALQLVPGPDDLHFLSEFGLVFLLFSLGLEFSLARMTALRHTVFGLGSAQVALCSLFFWSVLHYVFGMSSEASLITAGALGLSSTAIVTQELTRWNELNSVHGHSAIGILLFQDLAAVLFLIMVPALAGTSDHSFSLAIGLIILKGFVLFIAMLATGKWLMPFIFHEVSKTRSEELFVMTVLLVVLTAAWITHAIGLSMALGAFIAGMMLGESHFKHQIEADIRPFRDILLGLFFVTVGMQLDYQVLISNLHWVVLGSLGLIASKGIMISLLASMLGKDRSSALRTGLVLAQGGEFGFALLTLALANQLLKPGLASLIVAIIVVSIAVTPFLIRFNSRISLMILPDKPFEPSMPHDTRELAEATSELEGHIIVCGFGRVGQTVARFMKKENLPLLALDNDPIRVQEAAGGGENIFYGDSSSRKVLEATGVSRARLIVVTVNEYEQSLAIIRAIRDLNQQVPVVVRTRDDSHLEDLKRAGATEVIPEALEGSLMLVTHVMSQMHIPFRRIARMVQTVRQQRYQLLHGYFHGGHSQLIDKQGNPLLRLHPVQVSPTCFAHNKTIADLKLSQVEILNVHRKNAVIESPDNNFIIQSGDTLILQGMADHIEQAESRLYGG
ncbi:cation:proton antiporter [Oceanospirillum sp. D5]|uniref:Cation:proton antiporter n=2 Tax=Oceanospirillum sediminis TaxID=2760088 RepID=A0A839IKN3_9GAMM|nr:cation:proton antiporter [Oceanospirillum sediminis]